MEIECYKLDLGMDAPPAIGTGFRVVFAKVGYKWAHLCTVGLHTGDMPRKAFDRAVIEKVERHEISPQTRKQLHEAARRYLKYKEATQFRNEVVRWLS